ncbi:MAG: ATP-binding protein [Candidatus Thiodiazotropha sp. (ex Lucinoma borealis)]|nr:ATP-binding protein [Candidatus Thiodiazotropha sp. (ex Lucinoma borealis)]MCU7801931.1 ATP-binding protein [Candidatus Thiodiazotropha sp. (ex Lucinoma borealis)]MCU7863834.1 ATP-binding protein [Candidatus Thiodiazotropha sp. (ex Lucinoma borealis)]
MARADLLLSLVKTGIEGDQPTFRKTVQAIAAEEKAKRHYALAERLTELLQSSIAPLPNPAAGASDAKLQNAYYVVQPKRTLDDLVLPEGILKGCQEIIEEHHRRDLLRSYNLEPRHRILLSGPPGNGKTSLAEAFAHELMIPLFVVKYEGIIGSYLGETAQQLDRLFEKIKSQRCVVFFDEFDALGKERADPNEVGEIKRVVNSLLMQIDLMPCHVTVIAATNHSDMLDKAAWRRFQAKLLLPSPAKSMIEKWLSRFRDKVGHELGMSSKVLSQKLEGLSFSEVEDFALDVQRRYILSSPNGNIKNIVQSCLKQRQR